MTILTESEMQNVNGGLIPFIIGIGKGISYGVAIGAAIWGSYSIATNLK